MYSPSNSQMIRSTKEIIFDSRPLISGLRKIHPNRLALLVMVFALGSIFTRTNPEVVYSWFAIAWRLLNLPSSHHLTASSIALVETLHMMVTFLFATGRPKAPKAAWPILGSCVRVACSLGLHRNSGRFGLTGSSKTTGIDWRGNASPTMHCEFLPRLRLDNTVNPSTSDAHILCRHQLWNVHFSVDGSAACSCWASEAAPRLDPWTRRQRRGGRASRNSHPSRCLIRDFGWTRDTGCLRFIIVANARNGFLGRYTVRSMRPLRTQMGSMAARRMMVVHSGISSPRPGHDDLKNPGRLDMLSKPFGVAVDHGCPQSVLRHV